VNSFTRRLLAVAAALSFATAAHAQDYCQRLPGRRFAGSLLLTTSKTRVIPTMARA
jgi:hypothetical protein